MCVCASPVFPSGYLALTRPSIGTTSVEYPLLVEASLANEALTAGGAKVVDVDLKPSPQNGALIFSLKKFAESVPGMRIWQEEAAGTEAAHDAAASAGEPAVAGAGAAAGAGAGPGPLKVGGT